MKLLWVATDTFYRAEGGMGLSCDLASARYRVLTPVSALNEKGHKVTLAVINETTPPETLSKIAASFDYDAVIFAKTRSDMNLELARIAKQKGAKVVFDVCDPFFELPETKEPYCALAQIADLMVGNTPVMKEVISRHTFAPCEVIPDPYESVKAAPTFAPQRVLKLLWFGFPINLDSLQEKMPELWAAAAVHPATLTVVTRMMEDFDVPGWCAGMQAEGNHMLPMRLVPWSAEAQRQELQQADLVVIPTRDGPFRQTKSANRVIESMMSGRMVVAHSLPAYEAFAEWAWIGDDLAEGIAWTLEHRDEIPARIAAAQQHIEAHYSPEQIARKWEDVLTRAIMAKPAAA